MKLVLMLDQTEEDDDTVAKSSQLRGRNPNQCHGGMEPAVV
jgi:hypothetical protein